MERVRQDLRIAVRLLMKDRGFAAATIATLALCLAANAAIFAVVNAVLLRPLPYPEPERLITMFNAYPGTGAVRGANAAPDYFDRLQETDVFAELALYTWTGVTIGGHGQGDAERIQGMTVTPSFFRTLAVRPMRGRLFDDSDAEIGRPHTVILSDRLWRRLFPGHDDVKGADLRVNGEPHTVIGVMPAAFNFDPDVQLWLPAQFSPESRADNQHHNNQFQMIGRLAPGATLAQAQRHIDALNARNLESLPQLKQILIDAGFHTPVLSLQDDLVQEARPTILLLWGGVLLLLVIGCVNVANLASIRATTRSREMATRLALGTTVARLMQQSVTESLLLSVTGAAAGVLLAASALRSIELLGLDSLPRRTEIALDGQVMGFTFALVTVVTLVVGLWPVLSVRRASLAQVMRDEGRAGTASPRARAIRRTLVTSQVAFALMLLMGAGLLLASFQRVLGVNVGFRPDHVLTGDVNLPASSYAGDPETRTTTGRILTDVRRMPGVAAAGLTSSIPFGKVYSNSVILAEGHHVAPGESLISPNRIKVSDGYFEAMGVTLKAGRFIDARDTEAAPRAVVVDEPLARRFWPGADPVGRRMYFPSGVDKGLTPPPESERLTVVGVVKEMRLRGIGSNAGSGLFGTYFLSYRQFPERHVTFALRTEQDPPALIRAVRATIARIDPDLAFYDARPMDALVDRALVDRRTTMALALGFAAVALLLSGIGIYGVLAYDVRQRTREIAIRMALGADRAAIVGMVIRQAAVVVAAGVILGLGGTFLIRRTVESQLYEVGVMDPAVVTCVAGVLLVVVILACTLPARRAASTHPTAALADQ
jgi:predicted permease